MSLQTNLSQNQNEHVRELAATNSGSTTNKTEAINKSDIKIKQPRECAQNHHCGRESVNKYVSVNTNTISFTLHTVET